MQQQGHEDVRTAVTASTACRGLRHDASMVKNKDMHVHRIAIIPIIIITIIDIIIIIVVVVIIIIVVVVAIGFAIGVAIGVAIVALSSSYW